jgi:two-component system CheB/CheR fusion protein
MNSSGAVPAAGWLARFLETTPDYALILTSPDGIIREWLGAAERVIGYPAAEARGRSLSILFTEDDLARGLDAHEIAVAHAQGRSEDDRWHVRKDGSRFWASGVLTSLRGDDGSVIGLCKVLRDKTDVRIQLQGLENSVRTRDEALAQRAAFMSSIAHELRNPLMPIVSALGLLQRPDAAHLTGKAVKILDHQVAILRRLVDDLNKGTLDIDSPIRLTMEPVDLQATLRLVTDSLGEAAAAKQQHLSLVLPPATIRVRADPQRLQQMLLNLVGNAIKYTPRGGHVDLSASVEADMAVIRIEDDGIGIAPDVLPRIFELFTREERQPDIEGQGIGLAVVKRLAALHGGYIEARSAGHDKGSVFGLRLPLHQEGEARPA